MAVIGAGLSGLAAAQALRAEGLDVQVFEKARGPGGRTSTRRHDAFSFDHGAQYFTVRDAGFAALVTVWESEGIVAPWSPRVAVVGEGGPVPRPDAAKRYVGVPGMNAVARRLAGDLAVAYATRVGGVERQAGRHVLRDEGGARLGSFDALVVSAPPAQAAPLLAAAPDLAAVAAGAKMLPCWAGMAVFEPALSAPVDAIFGTGDPLAWIARNSSKPGRPAADTWVLHAGPDWSAARLEDDAGAVANELLGSFLSLFDATDRRPRFLRAHRWRYALPVGEIPDGPCLWDPDLRIGACGDWLSGARVEGAILSGRALAERVRTAR